MIKKLNRLRGKKGTTLAEVLIVLLITSILLAIAFGMLAPVKRLMNSVKANAHMDAMCDTANEFVRGSIHNATKVSLVTYGASTSMIKDKAQQAIDWKLAQDAAGADSGKYKVKAIAVHKNTAGKFRLYDFGEITDANALATMLSTPNVNASQYGVFNEPFYENCSLKMDINDINPDTGGTTDWITVQSQSIISEADDGTVESANQPRGLKFKLLNNSSGLDISGGGKDSVDITGGSDPSGFVVIYVVLDFDATLAVAP